MSDLNVSVRHERGAKPPTALGAWRLCSINATGSLEASGRLEIIVFLIVACPIHLGTDPTVALDQGGYWVTQLMFSALRVASRT